MPNAFLDKVSLGRDSSGRPLVVNRRTMAMLKDNLIDAQSLITHRFPITEADKAWHLTKAAGDSLKVMVQFS